MVLWQHQSVVEINFWLQLLSNKEEILEIKQSLSILRITINFILNTFHCSE